MDANLTWKLPLPGRVRLWVGRGILAGLVVTCLYNVNRVVRRAEQLRYWQTNIDRIDQVYLEIQKTLISMNAPASVGYVLDGPFDDLPVEIQAHYVLAQYGLAPILIHAATAQDQFVILDANAQLRPDVLKGENSCFLREGLLRYCCS
jgi:hypothetical protein